MDDIINGTDASGTGAFVKACRITFQPSGVGLTPADAEHPYKEKLINCREAQI